MKKKDIEYFKNRLSDRLEELLSQADSTVSGMTAQKENFPDPTDPASLEVGQEMELVVDTLSEDDENEYLVWKWRPADA